MWNTTLPSTSALEGVGGKRHGPATLSLGKTRYPLYRRLGGPQGRSGRVRKTSSPCRFDPRTVQPVASHYKDWAISAHIFYQVNLGNLLLSPKGTNRLFAARTEMPVTATQLSTGHSLFDRHLVWWIKPNNTPAAKTSLRLHINKIQRDAIVCRCLFTAKLLYMFRVSIAPIIRSTSNCNCSFRYRS